MFGSGKAQQSGPEMMLRSMGLGEVLDAAKSIASSGTIEKILKFADGLEELNARLAKIERRLGIESSALIEGEVINGDDIRGAEVVPGSDPADVPGATPGRDAMEFPQFG